MFLADAWTDYEILDLGGHEKLERWGDILLIRPDPQVVWKQRQNPALWKQAHGHYHRSKSGGGQWEFLKPIPERFTVRYKDLTFGLKPMGFKHTGLFPEQAANWDFFTDKIRQAKKQDQQREIRVLNLFAYTGGATVACAAAGANVCHVDAAKGMVQMAKENMALSGLENASVRYIVDDVVKFVQRELRRGKQYDGIIMDPPSYGRGPGGEVFKIEDQLDDLLSLCMQVLSDAPLFFVINSYTTGFSHTILDNILKMRLKSRLGGTTQTGELGLPVKNAELVLPCGITGRWASAESAK